MVTSSQLQEIFKDDAMIKLLGIEIVSIEPGYAETNLIVTPTHLNSVQMTHGAVIFAMADVTMALASNMHGVMAVAMQVSINFLKASTTGDRLIAIAKEDILTKRTGVYRIEIRNNDKELLAVAEGTVSRKN